MIKILVIGLTAIAAALGVILLVASRKPKEFTITRSILVHAARTETFPWVNELRRWEQWSPWVKMDPSMKKGYEGPAAGEGAASTWDSKKVGAGRMTIVKSETPSLLQMQLNFERPMKSTNQAQFTFQSEGQGTRVTWSMHCNANLISRVMCVFMDMDKMVGADFEKGLHDIKSLAEAAKK